MDRPLRVLIVEDSTADTALLVTSLQAGGYDVDWTRVDRARTMKAALDGGPWHVVIADYNLPYFSGLEALSLVQERDIDIPVIIVSRALDEEVAVLALHLGATDYVMKSNLARLAPAVLRAIRETEERRVRRQAEEALRESEERYRELVENANDIVLSIDLNATFTSLNRAGELISGYTRQELYGRNIRELLTPESFERAMQMIRKKLADNQPTTYELEMIARDGHTVPIEVSSRLVLHGEKPVGVQAIARDITERKRAAEALRENEERYRSLFENASDIVYTHDLAGAFTSVNGASERVTGYTRDEILRSNIADIVAPDHLDRARAMIQQKLREGGPTTYELDIITRDGRRVTVEVNTHLIYGGGEPVGVQGIGRDVTARRRAEEELRARERKQAAVAELGQRALASTDLETLFQDAVLCVTQTLDLEYGSILELLPEGDRLAGRAGVGWKPGVIEHTTVDAGPGSQAGYTLVASRPVVVEDLSVETRFSIPPVLTDHDIGSGMSVIIHGQFRPFGTLSAFTGARRAFTQDDVLFLQAAANVLSTAIERKRLEEERARHSKELATRVIQAQEEERKRIARELHDETAQSLSVLLAHLDLLEQHISAGEEQLKAGFERVGALARRALDETRALSHDLRPTILDDVGLVAALDWLAAEHEQTYGGSVDFDADVDGYVLASPELEVALFRIAQEALTNIGKHAGASSVQVSLSCRRDCARLVVEDDGSGFDLDRVPRPTREGRLGLFGMHERAMLLGGTLEIVTRPGKGTRISVEIPLEQEPSAGAALSLGAR